MPSFSNVLQISAPVNLLRTTAFQNVLAVGITGGSGSAGAPVVTLVSPAQGSITSIAEITVDVTDPVALRRVLIAARFPASGAEELIHNGSRFAAGYAGSTRDAIPNGYRYTLSRTGGWAADMVVDFYAIDTTGSEA